MTSTNLSYSPVKVYFIFKGDDISTVEQIVNAFKDKGIDNIAYQDRLSENLYKENYEKWNKEAHYVLFVITNSWISGWTKDLREELQITFEYNRKNQKNGRRFFAFALEGTETNELIKEKFEAAGIELFTPITHDNFSSKIIQLEGNIMKDYEANHKIKPIKTEPIGSESKKLIPKFASDVWISNNIKFLTEEDNLEELYWLYSQYQYRHYPIIEIANNEQGTPINRLIDVISYRNIIEKEPPDSKVLDYLQDEKKVAINRVKLLNAMPVSIKELRIHKGGRNPKLVTIKQGTPIKSVIKEFIDQKRLGTANRGTYISCLPVESETGELQGIVTYIDILKKFSEFSSNIPNLNCKVEEIDNFVSVPDVVYLTPNDSISKANHNYQILGFRDFPVVENEQTFKLLGMINDIDIKKNLHDALSEHLAKVPVEKIMTPAQTERGKMFTKNAKIGEIANYFLEDRKTGAVPITENGKLVGIVSYIDILKRIYNNL
jgi:CBS domain-containing protein